MKRLSFMKLCIAATAPDCAVEIGRITETGGKLALRNTVGSGKIKLVWNRLSAEYAARGQLTHGVKWRAVQVRENRSRFRIG